jgi:hypothetical protein
MPRWLLEEQAAIAAEHEETLDGEEPSEIDAETTVSQVIAQGRRGLRGRDALDAALAARVLEATAASHLAPTGAAPIVARQRESHGQRRTCRRDAGGSSDDPSDPEPPLGRPPLKFEVSPLGFSRRPKNGHKPWPGSVVLREVVLDESLKLRAARNAVARARIEREDALDRQKQEKQTCSRCRKPVCPRDVCPGRKWCRKCENERRRRAYHAAKARAVP